MSQPIPSTPGVPGLHRRRFLAVFGGTAAAATALPEILWAEAEEGPITHEVLQAAEKLVGLELTESERELMLEDLAELTADYAAIRELRLDNSLPPAFAFDPLLPGRELPVPRPPEPTEAEAGPPPGDEAPDALFFLPAHRLAALLRAGEISSLELTRCYLERLARHGPELEAVISLTEERALEEAHRADRELAAGRSRGPLHGVPWGAKDLLAARGARTTWGATPFKEQAFEEDATVVSRLGEAGAVLVAKLTLGALAWGDVWFGGKTRNPWKVEEGSSGSSAGPAAATSAGLVGFSLGSETWGSIVSPATRCGATGLRPTFGHVSRHGAMALAWTMDKLGPICRDVEDCARVLEAIHGPDGRDDSVVPAAFRWSPGAVDLGRLKVGYVEAAFEAEREDAEWAAFDRRTLEELERLGFELVPIELPDLPVEPLSFILSAEAAAAFDDLTRSGRDDLLVRQVRNAWPNVFRQARFIPAVEYIQANRVRTLLMREMEALMAKVDLYVCPSFGAGNLLLTNLTGHPCVVLPNGFRDDGTPTSITFNGRLFGENALLAAARTYQEATGFHRRYPEHLLGKACARGGTAPTGTPAAHSPPASR